MFKFRSLKIDPIRSMGGDFKPLSQTLTSDFKVNLLSKASNFKVKLQLRIETQTLTSKSQIKFTVIGG